MELLVLVPLWLIAGVLVGFIAASKGKSGCAWFIYGFLLAPIAFIHVLIATSEPAHQTRQALSRGRLGLCPYCREAIKPDALKCKHCGSDLRGDQPESGESTAPTVARSQPKGPDSKVIVKKTQSSTGRSLVVGGLVFFLIAYVGTLYNTQTRQAQPQSEPRPASAVDLGSESDESAPPQSGVVFAPPSPVAVPSNAPNPLLFEVFAGMEYFEGVAYESSEPGDPFLNLYEISADEAVGDDIGYRYFLYEGGRPDDALLDVCPAGYETTWFAFESDSDAPIEFGIAAEVHDLEAGTDVWFGPIFMDGYRTRAGSPTHVPPVYVGHCSFSDTRGTYYRSNSIFIKEAETTIVGPGPRLSCAIYVTNLQSRRSLASETGNHLVYCNAEY